MLGICPICGKGADDGVIMESGDMMFLIHEDCFDEIGEKKVQRKIEDIMRRRQKRRGSE